MRSELLRFKTKRELYDQKEVNLGTMHHEREKKQRDKDAEITVVGLTDTSLPRVRFVSTRKKRKKYGAAS